MDEHRLKTSTLVDGWSAYVLSPLQFWTRIRLWSRLERTHKYRLGFRTHVVIITQLRPVFPVGKGTLLEPFRYHDSPLGKPHLSKRPMSERRVSRLESPHNPPCLLEHVSGEPNFLKKAPKLPKTTPHITFKKCSMQWSQ